MKAMLSIEPGGPEALVWRELPDLSPAPGEIRIKIMAAGVNFPDTLIIQDLYQIKPPRPFAPGGEVAGVVVETGAQVSGFSPGDRVLSLVGYGGFASEVCAPAHQVVKIPDQMSFEQAAAFVFTYGTSYHALKDRAALSPGERLLILGAAGGVGAAAIELGKAMGAKIIAAVSTEEKAAFCKSLGADEVCIYDPKLQKEDQRNFSSQIKELSGKGEVDVVYDAVGGFYAEPALRCLSWGGRYLVVGFPAGIPEIPLNLPLLKGCDIRGVFWGASVQHDPKGHMQNMIELQKLFIEGKITPRIWAEVPMHNAAQALQMLSRREVMGKVVLVNR